MYDFALQRPQSLNEAIEALSAEGAQALAGGQTLIPTLKNRLASPDVLVSIGGISELQGVSETDGTVSIKAGTTHGVVAATVES